MEKILGKSASNGISFAKSFVLENNNFSATELKNIDKDEELKKLRESYLIAEEQIKKLRDNAKQNLGEEKAQIFDAHIQILKDPEMEQQIKELIENEFINASFSIQKVAKTFIEIFSSMEDDYMKERAADIADVTTRLAKIVEGVEIMDLTTISEPIIIVAHDLTPSETSQLNPEFVKGFITQIGGRTSHSAIMARSLEIPAVVGVGDEFSNIKNGIKILIDGSTGEIVIEPSDDIIEEFNSRQKILMLKKEEEKKFIDKESISVDGWKTKIAANIGSLVDVKGTLKVGADGVGLFRSEFLYMDAKEWPTEEEQFEAYKEVLERVGSLVVIRTLDIGGDKTLNYYEFPKEDNPFLGYRAIRMQLDNKEVLDAQFRALLRASAYGNLAINVPMIATINEFKKVKSEFKRVQNELEAEGVKVGNYQLGIMVEVPSVVALADKFAKYADFFSVGTNDLIQYTFAADRMSPNVSNLYQPFNPSILRQLKIIIDASHKEGKWTAICGELAGEPMIAPVLVGMGLDEFSMSASSILNIRRIISKINKKEAEELVNRVLEMETSEEVIVEINKFLKNSKIEL